MTCEKQKLKNFIVQEIRKIVVEQSKNKKPNAPKHVLNKLDAEIEKLAKPINIRVKKFGFTFFIGLEWVPNQLSNDGFMIASVGIKELTKAQMLFVHSLFSAGSVDGEEDFSMDYIFREVVEPSSQYKKIQQRFEPLKKNIIRLNKKYNLPPKYIGLALNLY